MRLIPLTAFDDNYIWALSTSDGATVFVDPGLAAPVIQAVNDGITPAAILLTHHHDDHIGGVAELHARWPELPIYAPADARIPIATQRVTDGDVINLPVGDFQVIATPGHTLSHIAFYGAGHLFCGDTLFSLGCGRMFEGSAAQMLHSLQRLAQLPVATRLCCAHEYTLSNAKFAITVDPHNAALATRITEIEHMRQHHQPSLPVTLESELATNPFLRTATPAIVSAITQRLQRPVNDEIEVFAQLRLWKDQFRA